MSSNALRPGWRRRLIALYVLAFVGAVVIATAVGVLADASEWVPTALAGLLIGSATGPLVARWIHLSRQEADLRPRDRA